MAIYERGESFIHWITLRDRDNNLATPSTVSVTIKDPCDFTLINSATMFNSSTGLYFYNYDTIESTATYGRYSVIVTATSSTGQKGIYEDEFFVMPWKIQKDVRQITGVSETKDINDDDLSDICWKAYKEALRDVYRHHYKIEPLCNPDTGASFDGSNTCFQTQHYPIADVNGDGIVTGNNSSCATDIDGWWLDNTGTYKRAVITVSQPKSKNGEIKMFQNDGITAIPADNEGVFIDYWSEYGSYDTDMFRNAVSHLAADYLIRRLKEIDRVTLADLASNSPIVVQDGGRFYKKYKQLINRVRKPRVNGVR